MQQQATGKGDNIVVLSPSKASELSVKSGENVVLIGRRRCALFAIVKVKKGKKSKCIVSPNMASNLRVRNEDKIKVLKMGVDDDQPLSGDMELLKTSTPPKVASVTLSPIEDSLSQLEAREGGDEISTEELTDRFVTPYLNLDESSVLLKKGHVLTLTDDAGRRLDFTVSEMELDGQPPKSDNETEEGE